MNKDLEKEVLEMVIEKLGLEDVNVEETDYDAPLFESYAEDGEGLGLDSVDALELVVGINQKYGIKIGDEDMAVLRSISSIADFIRENKEV